MFIYQEEVRIRHQELLAEAEKYRLISNLKTPQGRRKPIYPRAMTWIGSQMLTWGYWLTSRFGEQTIIAQSGSGDTRVQGSH